jgi:predicted NBD/HSP70 family sugar kinase
LKAGVDLGGTKIQAVVVGDRGARVLGAARRDTPTRGGPEAVATEIARAVRDAATT